MLSEVSQTQKDKYDSAYVKYLKWRNLQRNRVEVIRGQGRRKWGVIAKWLELFLGVISLEIDSGDSFTRL